MSWRTILKYESSMVNVLFYTEAPNPVYLVTAEISDWVEANRDIRMATNTPTNARGNIEGVEHNYFNFGIFSDEYSQGELFNLVMDKLVDLGWETTAVEHGPDTEKLERNMYDRYMINAVLKGE